MSDLVRFLRAEAWEHLDGITKMGHRGQVTELKLWKAADRIEADAINLKTLAKLTTNQAVTIEQLQLACNDTGALLDKAQARIEELEKLPLTDELGKAYETIEQLQAIIEKHEAGRDALHRLLFEDKT